MVVGTNSASELLEAAYTTLGLNEGELLSADFSPTEETTLEQWLDKGDWLSLAKQVGAEKIFFVEDDPVIVFAKSQGQDSSALRKVFNDVWCMARPQRLFLARDGELAVYDLTKPPVKKDEQWEQNRPLAVAKSVAEVAIELKNYHREMIESGKLFEEERFGEEDQRADQSLIRDLKTVRARLTNPSSDKKLKRKYAHALIGRSIFIRYLEDRDILTRDYFENVTIKYSKPEWKMLLDAPLNKPDLNTDMEALLYPRVLSNKDFTYALFDQLSEDFNGDMFPSDPDEREAVDIQHLKLLQEFLRGDIDAQKSLFFWAYRFDIIPIELISSIYEEFYLTENSDSGNHGTHYTPSSLVRFVLSQVLTPECLEKNPRILDPCCSSGIFLVEAFRRIVRYRVYKQNGKRLSSKELRKVIRDQLAGIEINEEAVRVAAFSLYLALLHFQEPPAIWKQIEKGQRLPSLKYQENSSRTGEKFNNLIEANAFDIDQTINDKNLLSRFNSNCADVVVGNPPWGSPQEDDKEGKGILGKALDWCKKREYPVGDDERSQAFIWRTLDFLRNEGYAGLLVSAGILFKSHVNSKKFRKKWLSSVRLIEVVNFIHARDIFFSEARSPFASLVFQKKSEFDPQYQLVRYFSVRKTAQVRQLKAVVLSYIDLQQVRQIDFLENDKLWKIYWWGNHRDAALIERIQSISSFEALRELYDKNNSGQGFSKGKKDQQIWSLPDYKYLPASKFQRYGPIKDNWFEQHPEAVTRIRKEALYKGDRLLIKHGITQSDEIKGQIIARVESNDFCFTNSINCIKLLEPETWKYKVILGILWSSLPRYYFFLTSSKWGVWYDGIYQSEYLDLPIAFPDNEEVKSRIVNIVERLQDWEEIEYSLVHPAGETREDIQARLKEIELHLDEAVFDLYRLRGSERDLIRDMCDIGIEFCYNHTNSEAVKPVVSEPLGLTCGLIQTLESDICNEFSHELKNYLTIFLKIWNRELSPEGEFSWRVIASGKSSTMLCILFSTQEIDHLPEPLESDEHAWSLVLEKLDDALVVPYSSNSIYVDGVIRTVTDTDIIIIKRNEKRLWTRSMAREDAEATLLQAINLQESRRTISV